MLAYNQKETLDQLYYDPKTDYVGTDTLKGKSGLPNSKMKSFLLE